MQYFLLSILSLATVALSAPAAGVKKSCKDYIVPLEVTTENLIWTWDKLETNTDITLYNSEAGRRDAAEAFKPYALPTESTTATYNIAGTFCQPSSGADGTVLLATHGGGFDRSYWHPSYQPENYSFVDHAVAQGYTIFYYDRVGLGKSDKISGYVAQASIHEAIIKGLIATLRTDLFGLPATKVVLVAHSMGSIYSNGVMHSDPKLADGAILTGIAYNVTGTPTQDQSKQNRLAKLLQPKKWADRDGGWVSGVDEFSDIENFWKVPFYDPAIIPWFTHTKQPSTLMENISSRKVNFTSPSFTGPILILNGQYDWLACGGNCGDGFLEQKVKTTFPDSVNVTTHVQADNGHAVNFGLNAKESFEVITGFLGENGFKPKLKSKA